MKHHVGATVVITRGRLRFYGSKRVERGMWT
jgi:hypothetical protein